MAILRVRDANGNVQEILAIRGENYVLTEEDKREIAEMVAPGETVDLSNYYTKTEVDSKIPSVPTNVSAFTNDAGYLTQHQSLDGYAKKTDLPNMSNYYTKAETDALLQNLPAEAWTFTLEDGSTVTKTVVLK